MFDKAALDAYVKRRYDPKQTENMLSALREPCYASLGSKTDGSGDDFSWLADDDDSYNGSPDFAEAQTGATNNVNTVGSKYRADWMPWSAVAQLTTEIIGKTRNNDGAWMQAYDVAFLKTSKGMEHVNALMFQGQGWGEIGQITTVVGATFKPLIPSDIRKYIKGMPIVFSSTLNTAVLRSATRLWVTAVNYTPGSELVTLSGNLATPGGVANDWAFIAGARDNSATPVKKAMTGFDAWCPNQIGGVTDATISTLFTVVRSNNSRLYGTFIDATGGGSKIGALIDGVTEAITTNGATNLQCFSSSVTFAEIAKDLQNGVRYDGNPTDKSVGTKKLTIYSDGLAKATLEISRMVNDTKIIGFEPSAVIKKSIGEMPHIDKEDGLTIARIYNSEGYESRLYQQGLFQFKKPTTNLRIQLV